MNKNLFIPLAVLALVAMACGINTNVPPTATSAPNVIPTLNTGANSSGSVLFQDSFSDPTSGWDRNTGTDGSTDYQYGGYRINVVTANTYLWGNPGKSLPADVSISVDATQRGGSDNNAFGVLCRYQDTNNFYKFYISSDGYSGIVKMDNGNSTVISSPDGKMQQVNGINLGLATNHLQADCIGSTLTLYANGNQVATASDTTITTGGDTGLVAAAYDSNGTDMLFTNFVVSQP